jgi:hypothetical protein
LLASGICVGITILFRHDVGIATAVGGAVTLGLFHMTQALDALTKVSAFCVRSRSMQAASRYPCCQLSRSSSRPAPGTICSSISFLYRPQSMSECGHCLFLRWLE